MPSDQQAPATKQDIHLLMEQMGKYYQQTAQRFADMEERMKEMAERITREGKETRHYFDVVAENIKHDFLHGALPDKIEQHEDRIVRLEQHVGLAA
ncbi:hypothetical protein A2789_03745 [Candidatus Peribacteria bacterium RIFCSPHIGHO2_01_FULL_54_22]|nr:MAG: hypothetical protein A2789_03745 [Candidatus Peribacteria bacterium RIFCSPHIGHO2_01_FULL_54_22]